MCKLTTPSITVSCFQKTLIILGCRLTCLLLASWCQIIFVCIYWCFSFVRWWRYTPDPFLCARSNYWIFFPSYYREDIGLDIGAMMDSKFIVRFTFTRVVTTFFFFFFSSFSHSSWFLFTVFRFLVSFYFVYSFLLRPSKEKKKEKQPNPIFGYFVNDANRFFF